MTAQAVSVLKAWNALARVRSAPKCFRIVAECVLALDVTGRFRLWSAASPAGTTVAEHSTRLAAHTWEHSRLGVHV